MPVSAAVINSDTTGPNADTSASSGTSTINCGQLTSSTGGASLCYNSTDGIYGSIDNNNALVFKGATSNSYTATGKDYDKTSNTGTYFTIYTSSLATNSNITDANLSESVATRASGAAVATAKENWTYGNVLIVYDGGKKGSSVSLPTDQYNTFLAQKKSLKDSASQSTPGANVAGDSCGGLATKIAAVALFSFSPTTSLQIAMCSAITSMVNFAQWSIGALGGYIQYLLNMPARMMDDQATALHTAWTTILQVTLSLLTLALLLIAFANILNLDEKLGYGLNRMIPKIIISIIFAYFSYLITRALLDLASAFQAGLFSLSQSQKAPDISTAALTLTTGALKNIAASLPMYLLLLIIMIMLLLATAWLTILLIVRAAVIWVLIALAPAAMLMNILPFTESYYKQWWAEWWKWLFMGPAVAVMLYLASVILTAFQSSFKSGLQFDNFMFLIMAAVLIFMAGIIPLTMGGKLMSSITSGAKKVGGFAGKSTGITDRWNQFKSDRQLYKKQAVRKQVSGLRGAMSQNLGGVGRVMAGTGGLRKGAGFMGTDRELAVMAESETIKSMGDQERMNALKSVGGFDAAQKGSPRAVALMQTIAKETHEKSWDEDTRQSMRLAQADSTPELQGIRNNIKANADADAARDLLLDKQEATVAAMGGEEKYGTMAFEAVKKSAGKTTFDSDGDDIKALIKVERDLTQELQRSGRLSEKSSQALGLATTALDKHQEIINRRDTNYLDKTPPKKQQEQATEIAKRMARPQQGPEYHI